MRCPFAVWLPSPNYTRAPVTPKFVVMHIQEGTQTGTNAWVQNPASQVSAHFAVAKNGALYQYVDTDYRAWAEAAGNPYGYSIEHEGYSGDALTAQQIATDAKLIAWLWGQYPTMPRVVTDNPNGDGGIIGHGEGGVPWGNHPQCPGAPILTQRQTVLDQTLTILKGNKMTQTPAPITAETTVETWSDASEIATKWGVPVTSIQYETPNGHGGNCTEGMPVGPGTHLWTTHLRAVPPAPAPTTEPTPTPTPAPTPGPTPTTEPTLETVMIALGKIAAKLGVSLT